MRHVAGKFLRETEFTEFEGCIVLVTETLALSEPLW